MEESYIKLLIAAILYMFVFFNWNTSVHLLGLEKCKINRGIGRSGQLDKSNQFESNQLNWFELVQAIGSIGYNPIRSD